jgi:hypothetical protein
MTLDLGTVTVLGLNSNGPSRVPRNHYGIIKDLGDEISWNRNQGHEFCAKCEYESLGVLYCHCTQNQHCLLCM